MLHLSFILTDFFTPSPASYLPSLVPYIPLSPSLTESPWSSSTITLPNTVRQFSTHSNHLATFTLTSLPHDITWLLCNSHVTSPSMSPHWPVNPCVWSSMYYCTGFLSCNLYKLQRIVTLQLLWSLHPSITYIYTRIHTTEGFGTRPTKCETQFIRGGGCIMQLDRNVCRETTAHTGMYM